VNFDSRGVTAAAPRGDFGSLGALERLAGQSELGAVAWWVVGIGAAVWWDMRLACKHGCFVLVWLTSVRLVIFIDWLVV